MAVLEFDPDKGPWHMAEIVNFSIFAHRLTLESPWEWLEADEAVSCSWDDIVQFRMQPLGDNLLPELSRYRRWFSGYNATTPVVELEMKTGQWFLILGAFSFHRCPVNM